MHKLGRQVRGQQVPGRQSGGVAGPVRENLTFRLFFIVGTAMTFGALLEYLVAGRPIAWSAVVNKYTSRPQNLIC